MGRGGWDVSKIGPSSRDHHKLIKHLLPNLPIRSFNTCNGMQYNKWPTNHVYLRKENIRVLPFVSAKEDSSFFCNSALSFKISSRAKRSSYSLIANFSSSASFSSSKLCGSATGLHKKKKEWKFTLPIQVEERKSSLGKCRYRHWTQLLTYQTRPSKRYIYHRVVSQKEQSWHPCLRII